MTGGGLYVLVSYGSQNVILSGNPQMTYYYKIFKRYSHFSMESVSIALDGPNTLPYDNPIQLRCKIQRISDLLSDMIFSFELPDIYSKAISSASGLGSRTYEYEFQWVQALGTAIIRSAEFFIGGQSIQRFDGTYLYSKALLEYDTATFEKWKIMVGYTNELTAPAAGAFAASSGSGPVYPTVVRQRDLNFTCGVLTTSLNTLTVTNVGAGTTLVPGTNFQYTVNGVPYTYIILAPTAGTTTGVGIYTISNPSGVEIPVGTIITKNVTPNRPSIFGQTIHVPLNFWFTDASSQALPLIALQNQECEVVLSLNPVQTLYTILDPTGKRVAPAYRTISATLNNPFYGSTAEIDPVTGLAVTTIQNFLTDVGVTAPLTWQYFNPRLQCTFVSLSDDERVTFATRPLTYLLPQLRVIPLGPVTKTSDTYDLELSNPITRFILIPRRSDWTFRNDFTNFTNWYTYPFAPLSIGNLGGATTYNNTQASGSLIANSQRDIIQSVRILCNGNEIQEEKPVNFLTKIYPYRYTSGNTNAEIPIYTWAITSSKTQPSGSINASRIKKFQIETRFFQLPVDTNYVYDFTLYVEAINFLVIASGSGAPKYVL